jgi:arylsulfatase A-like enzyme
MGMVGLFLGWLAITRWLFGFWKRVVLGCVMLGVAGAHIGWTIHLLQVWVAELDVIENPRAPLFWFAIVFTVALAAARFCRRRTIWLLDPEVHWPVRPWFKSLAAITLLLLSGITIHSANTLDFLRTVHSHPALPLRRPNIVLITLDTVRADHLSIYGYQRPTTPNLDRLASHGVLFEQAISSSSWTLPSLASIFTGLLPHQHGANIFSPLYASPRTLAEILASYGYETAGVNANGFGFPDRGLDQGFELYNDGGASLSYNLVSTLVGKAVLQPIYLNALRPDLYFRREARDVNRDVFHWLRGRSNRPYFLFINYFDAHDPHLAPAPYDRRFGQASKSAVQRVSFARGFPLTPPLTPEEKESLIAGYDNSLAFLDDQVDKLLRSLAASPDWANTIVIVTSDHGEAFDEHDQYLHGRTLYREELHVPLILAGPGIPAALRISHLVRTRELFATVLDLALGDSLPLQSFSLRRLWTPGYNPRPTDDLAVSELVPFLPDFTPVKASLMTSEWHYLHDSQGHEELYHWTTDPTEKDDLAGDPQYAPIVESLHKSLEARLAHSSRPWRGPDYLSALDRPGYSYQRAALFGAGFQNPPLVRGHPMGTAQSLFVADSPSPLKPLPQDIDLVNSLPYR